MKKIESAVVLVLLTLIAPVLPLSAQDVAGQAVQATGVRQGLAVVAGLKDPATALQLARSGSFVVEQLAADWSEVYALRKAFAGAGAFPLANAQFDGDLSSLPYAPQLVNLLILDADTLGSASPNAEEIRRALAWGGKAYIRHQGQWGVVDNPFPEDVDDWSHALRGPDRRPVSNDKRVGPYMANMRWFADSWENISQAGAGIRVSDGTLYYLRSSRDVNQVVARDAQNGILRWEREIPWAPDKFFFNREDTMEFTQHFAAGNGKVYGYFEEGGPLCAIDAKSGEIVMRYDRTARLPEGTSQTSWSDDVVKRNFQRLQPVGDIDNYLSANVLVVGKWLVQTWEKDIWVLEEATGRVLGHFQQPFGKRVGITMVGEDGHLYSVYAMSDEEKGTVYSLTMPDLKPRWKTPLPIAGRTHGQTGPLNGMLPIKLRGGHHGSKDQGLMMVDTSNGAILWSKEGGGGSHPVLLEDRLTVDGWTGSEDYDPRTGAEIPGHGISGDMAGCSYPTYTENYIIRGLTLHDRKQPNRAWAADGARPLCQMPTYPAYGNLFVFGTNCGCSAFWRAGMSVFYAGEEITEADPADRMMLSPGVSAVSPSAVRPLAVNSPVVNDWSRMDSFYKGAKGWNLANMPQGLQETTQVTETWYGQQHEIREVEADGWKVRVESTANLLRVYRGGEELWVVPLGGRVVTPPLLTEGQVLVGDTDGWLSAWSLEKGQLLWQYQAAPAIQRMLASSQVESVWPVSGLTTWQDQILVAAGRRDSFDDGIFVSCLDRNTGNVLWTETIARLRQVTDSNEARHALGYTAFGNKLSTLSGRLVANAHDTAFFMVGVIPVSPQLRTHPPRPARVDASTLSPGLNFTYYPGLPNRIRGLIDFNEMSPGETGITAEPKGVIPDLPAANDKRQDQGNYGFVFKGYLRIKEDGHYRFGFKTQHLSAMRIDGKVVAEASYTKLYSQAFYRGPLIPLKAGLYPVEVSFATRGRQVAWMHTLMQREGEPDATPIPAELFFH